MNPLGGLFCLPNQTCTRSSVILMRVECQFANTVSLDENIECYGRECRVDDVIVIQVKPGAFYEYIRQPCVQLSFYDNAKKVVTGYSPHVPGIGRSL